MSHAYNENNKIDPRFIKLFKSCNFSFHLFIKCEKYIIKR